jgi:hypothetical protein
MKGRRDVARLSASVGRSVVKRGGRAAAAWAARGRSSAVREELWARAIRLAHPTARVAPATRPRRNDDNRCGGAEKSRHHHHHGRVANDHHDDANALRHACFPDSHHTRARAQVALRLAVAATQGAATRRMCRASVSSRGSIDGERLRAPALRNKDSNAAYPVNSP